MNEGTVVALQDIMDVLPVDTDLVLDELERDQRIFYDRLQEYFSSNDIE